MPPTRLPTPNDLPVALNPILHPSTTPPSQSPSPLTISNILLLLPGLGDTSTNFAAFARALNLPDTLTLTLQPPFPLPTGITEHPAFHWSDDLMLSTSGVLDGTESGFSRATELLAKDVIVDVLLTKCGFWAEEIHLFGFGQGGSLALSVALHESLTSEGRSLGSVVSVGGVLPLNIPAARMGSGKNRTPVLVMGGGRGEVFGVEGASRMKRLRDRFEGVEGKKWASGRGDDGMPRSREEVLPLMRFWGRRLRSRRGVPEGAVEVR